MSRSQHRCYLCSQPKHLQKLAKKCKHESACYDCLRSRYVKQVQDASCYPLKCFHPDCGKLLRYAQIQVLCKSDEERWRALKDSETEKINKSRLGKDWKEFLDVVRALGEELCKCPSCGYIITKNGGCDDMVCVCGNQFKWNEAWGMMEKKLNYDIKIRTPEDTKIKRHKRLPLLKEDDLSLEDFSLLPKGSNLPSCSTKLNVKANFESWASRDMKQNEDQKLDCAGQDEASCGNSITPSPSVGENIGFQQTDEASFVDDFVLDEASLAASSVDCVFVNENCSSLAEWETDCHVAENDKKANQSASKANQGDATADWEELSEISSVHSVNSQWKVSFLHAARSSSARWGTASPKRECEFFPLTRDESKSIMADSFAKVEGEVNDWCDSDFCYDSTKTARGGKLQYLHKHRPKRK